MRAKLAAGLLLAPRPGAAATESPPIMRTHRIARLLPLLAVLLWAGLPAAAATLSDQDQICLGCHDADGMRKKLRDGDTLSLQIKAKPFAESVHGSMGCAACHSSVNVASHPGNGRRIDNARSFALAQVEVCKTCHEDKFKQYEGSVHATLLREGVSIAPVCSDCHNPHTVKPKTARATLADIPCQKCHGSIFEAYAGSVHGKALEKGEKAAPLCSSCHRAHDIAPATTGTQTRTACHGCHQNVLRSHQEWLPNAAVHLQVISCAACHVPDAKRRVDLRLYDPTAKQHVQEKNGASQFEALVRAADAKGQGIDATALQGLLAKINLDGGGKATLKGRLEVSDGTQIHQLAPVDKALSDCATCHRAGGAAFQSVSVSIVGADGRPVRFDAKKDILNSAVSVDSVRGFYAIGSTRIALLDWLLVLALLGGIAVPVCHQSARWFFRRYAEKRQADAAATGNKPDSDHSA